MRILGERSLVSMLKVLVDIAYFGLLAISGLVVVVIFLVAAFRPQNVSLELPARFDIDPSAYEISSPGTDASDVRIAKSEGQVSVRGATVPRVLLGFAAGLLLLGGSVLVLGQLRGVFRTLKAGKPFVQANIRRVRVLGLVVMFGEVLREALISLSSSALDREFDSAAIQFRTDFSPSMTVIFAGLLLLVLAEVFREAATMKRDLETARAIQFELVPAEEFKRGRIGVRSHMRPANTVGGDYYDIIPLDGDRLAVVQGDVAGKGMPAALLMAVLQGSLRTLITAGFSGARLIATLSDYINDNTPSNRMVTLFYGELDPDSGELRYVNAGHNRPFLLRRDGRLERPSEASMVLGILPGIRFEEAILRLDPGDRLLLFTDGISEAANPKDDEYGDERIATYLRERLQMDDESLVAGLIDDVLSHCNPGRPGDDMTLTLIRRS